MSDRKKKTPDLLGVNDDSEREGLEGDGESWDENFDSLFAEVGWRQPSGQSSGEPGDSATEGDLSAPIVEGRASYAGDDDSGDGVMTSALRPPDPDDDAEFETTVDLFADFDSDAESDVEETGDELTTVVDVEEHGQVPGGSPNKGGSTGASGGGVGSGRDRPIAAAGPGAVTHKTSLAGESSTAPTGRAEKGPARRTDAPAPAAVPVPGRAPAERGEPAGTSGQPVDRNRAPTLAPRDDPPSGPVSGPVTVPGRGSGAATAPAHKPPVRRAARRTPAIVRREDLERKRKVGGLFDDIFQERIGDSEAEAEFDGEATRVADAGQIEKMVELSEADAAAAEQGFPDPAPEPPATYEVDEEFYDDIVIGEQAEAETNRPNTTARRVSQNLLRRPSDNATAVTRPQPLPQPVPSQAERPGDDSPARPRVDADDRGKSIDPEITLDMRVTAEEIDRLPDQLPPPDASSPQPTGPADAGPSWTSAGLKPGSEEAQTVELEAQFDEDLELELVAGDDEPSQPSTPESPAAASPSAATSMDGQAADSEFEFEFEPSVELVDADADVDVDPGAQPNIEIMDGEVAADASTEPLIGLIDAPARPPAGAEITRSEPAPTGPSQLAAHALADISAQTRAGISAEPRAGISVETPAPVAPYLPDARDKERAAGPARAAHQRVERGPVLDDADVAPDLPPAKLPTSEPTIDFNMLALPDQVEPTDATAQQEAITEELLFLEREREVIDDPTATARLCLEAGRLAEKLGDLSHARRHYEDALNSDPRLSSAMRALRRVERSTGNWIRAVDYLHAEIPTAGPIERHTLKAHGVDLLMSCGQKELARNALTAMLDQDADNVRALFARLELAFAGDKLVQSDEIVEHLARVLDDADLAASLITLKAILAGHALGGRKSSDGEDLVRAASHAYQAAVEAGSQWHRMALSRLARRSGDLDTAMMASDELGRELRARDAACAAALGWRQALWADRDDRRAERLEALRQAAQCASGGNAPAAGSSAPHSAPGRPLNQTILLAELADAALAEGSDEEAATALLQLAGSVANPAEQASAYLRAAGYFSAARRGDEAVDALRRACGLDPCNPRALLALQETLTASGDVDMLLELDRDAAFADPAGAVWERVRAARRLAELDRHDEAIATLTQSSAEDLASPVLDEELVRELELAGRHDERIALLVELADRQAEKNSTDSMRILHRAATAATARAFWVDANLGRADTNPLAELDREPGRPRRRRNQAIGDAVDRAIDIWNRVLKNEPELALAHHTIVALAEMLEDSDVLEQALVRSQNANVDPWYAATLALRRMDVAGDTARAVDIGRQAVVQFAEDPRLAFALVPLLASDRQYDEAARVLDDRAASAASGDEAIALRYRAATLLLDCADRPDRAAEALETIAAARPQFLAAAEKLDVVRRRSGHVVDGVEPGRRASYIGLIRAAEHQHYRAGEPGKAIALYREALDIRPGDPLARSGLARAAEAAGEISVMAEMALQDLKYAEELGDGVAKADACEELARIDGELRSDPGSALLSYEAAAAADPSRIWVMRALERSYIAAGRWNELLSLYEREMNLLSAGNDKIALALERAHLAEQLDEPRAHILSHYRAIHELDRRSRLALFYLEDDARRQALSPSMAELEAELADYFAGDLRARTAFLTRAGESLLELGDIDQAIVRFREANRQYRDAHGHGYGPALFGWRYAAIQGRLWIDVAEAALSEAELAESDAERVALSHLAGVALMDRALNGERAVPALRRVLEADPGHQDAFVRLRILFDEQGQHEDLIKLLSARLDVAGDETTKARLHRSLADLYRNVMGDLELAKRHLRAILALIPTELGAIGALSEISWDQGAWSEAAETLMTRARLEGSPQVLKSIFYRLGIIYTDHLPDLERAIGAFKKVLSYAPQDEGTLDKLSLLGIERGDWKLALAACERLLKIDRDAETKVEYLHRIGHIYSIGMGDRGRAERALRLALDQAPTNDRALTALIEFFEKGGDIRSMRVHLDRVIGLMRMRLDTDISEGVAYRVIARALEARERAGVAGSLAGARCAAELALLFGFLEEGDAEVLAELAGHAGVGPTMVSGLERPDVDDRLFPASVPTAFRQLFGTVGERLAKHVGIDLRRYGVSRGDRLRKRDNPVLALAHEIAGQMGIDQPALYVSGKEPTLMACEPTSPVSIILGSALADPQRGAELRFCLGWALKLASSWFAVPARMSSEDFGVLLVALLRQFEPEFAATGVDADAVASQQQRLKRVIPGGMIQQLRPFALGIASERFDYQALHTGIQASGDRAGLVTCGSMRAALSVLCTVRGHSDLARGAAEDERIKNLVQYAVSEDHTALHGILQHR
ncbi:MAG: hypothetical protein MJE77_22390 [Proteobacteria bacterium]|nr:hypothetical protein [Pseudomonadota bacterium]